MAGIRLIEVTKSYPGSEEIAVDSLSLTVEPGEIVTLLGPSGCGKTTTLRLIAGFERPDSGTVTLGDRIVAGNGTWVPPQKRGVGMVFQDHALFPHLSVAGNVGFNLKRSSRAADVTSALELVGLVGFAGRMPHELSGGQQQRVALARALAHDPVVVLLDEPFSSLDADLRVQMRGEVRRILKEANATAVFVSHDQRDALAISDSVVVMREGRVEQAGTPRDVYQHPHTRFVASFVGHSNILAGTIAPGGRGIETSLGVLPSRHTHDLPPGTAVSVSVRPDSFELDADGGIAGRVVSATYAGTSVDVTLEADVAHGPAIDLLVHAHPERILSVGDPVRVRVLPDFVAVIEDD